MYKWIIISENECQFLRKQCITHLGLVRRLTSIHHLPWHLQHFLPSKEVQPWCCGAHVFPAPAGEGSIFHSSAGATLKGRRCEQQMATSGDDHLDSSGVDCLFFFFHFLQWESAIYMNPESGFQRCFLLLCFCDLFFLYVRHNHGLTIYTAMVGGYFSLQPMGDVSNFKSSNGSSKQWGVCQERCFFLPTQLDDMIWYDMIWYDTWRMTWNMTYDIWLWYDMIYQHPTSFWHFIDFVHVCNFVDGESSLLPDWFREAGIHIWLTKFCTIWGYIPIDHDLDKFHCPAWKFTWGSRQTRDFPLSQPNCLIFNLYGTPRFVLGTPKCLGGVHSRVVFDANFMPTFSDGSP